VLAPHLVTRIEQAHNLATEWIKRGNSIAFVVIA